MTLNREWIIGLVLESLLSQDYPRDKLHVLVLDAGSTDKTVEVAREILARAGVSHEVLVRKCSIPEGRNVCMEMARGAVLVFWDSDVLALGEHVLKDVVGPVAGGMADVLSAGLKRITLNSREHVEEALARELRRFRPPRHRAPVPVPGLSMALTAIARRVIEAGIRFDPELTWYEDFDFAVRAREAGFRVMRLPGFRALDVNVRKEAFSNIYAIMPLRDYARGLHKKARAEAYGSYLSVGLKEVIRHLSRKPGLLFCMSYPPVILLSALAAASMGNPLLLLLFPAYLLPLALGQVLKRGPRAGLASLVKSVLVGPIYAYLLVAYLVRRLVEEALLGRQAFYPPGRRGPGACFERGARPAPPDRPRRHAGLGEIRGSRRGEGARLQRGRHGGCRPGGGEAEGG